MALTVIDLCRTELIKLRPNLRARSALDLLQRARIHGAPVVLDNGRAVGVLTVGNLAGDLGASYVADRMSAPTVTADCATSVHDAAELMVAHALHHLVVTERGQTVGFLSALDIVAALLGHSERAPSPVTLVRDAGGD